MNYTLIPTEKGQITIPAALRKKYDIDATTPLIIEDKGKGGITIKVMQMVNHDDIVDYEDDKEFGLVFKKGISTDALIEAIKKIDG